MAPNGSSLLPHQIATLDHNNSLHNENEVLRRQLLDAQELLIVRNIQLATLEDEIETLQSPRSSPHNKKMLSTAVSSLPHPDEVSTGDTTTSAGATDAAQISNVEPSESQNVSYNTPALGLMVGQGRNLVDDCVEHEPPVLIADDTDDVLSETFGAEAKADKWATPTSTCTTIDDDDDNGKEESDSVPVTNESIPDISSGVDQNLFHIDVEHADYWPDSIQSLTTGIVLKSESSMEEPVPESSSPVKPTPLAFSSHTPETFSDSESESGWSTDEENTVSTVDSNHPSIDDNESYRRHDELDKESQQKTAAYAALDFSDRIWWASSMASSTIYTTTSPPISSRKGLPLPPKSLSQSQIQPSSTTSAPTFQVSNYKLTVANSHKEVIYSGSLSASTKLPHGQGTMVYDEFRSYIGSWKHGHWHGDGVVTCKAYTFRGEFVQGLKSGIGTLEHKNGDVYVGDWVKDRKSGNGKQVYGNGSVYEGGWLDGVKSGRGSLQQANGTHYFGYFHDDLYHGQGKLTYADGSLYFGQFKRGKKMGQGLALRADGSTLHEGMFLNDEPSRGYDKRRLEKTKFTSTLIEI